MIAWMLKKARRDIKGPDEGSIPDMPPEQKGDLENIDGDNW